MRRYPQSLLLENTYVQLARFLAPAKSDETLTALKIAVLEGSIDWEVLVFQANTQMCTPLWYARLKQDDLLQYLPKDLQGYLQVLYDSNLSRNQKLEEGLEELLLAFEMEQIDTVLLKGAATFVDDLYGAPGARYMGDLDVLIPEHKIEAGRQLLLKAGFEEIFDPYMELVGKPTDVRHHQIQRYVKPGTPIAVELHFKVSYGQAGRVMETDAAWGNAGSVVFREHKTRILSPTYRVLHNSVHGLLPHREFIKGEISLLQLAEFSALATRYGDKIDWATFKSICAQEKLCHEVDAYVGLSRKLMCINGADLYTGKFSKWHFERIVAVGAQKNESFKTDKLYRFKLKCFIYRVYYLLRLPSWFWLNVSYAVGEGALWSRIQLLLSRLIKIRSWKKI